VLLAFGSSDKSRDTVRANRVHWSCRCKNNTGYQCASHEPFSGGKRGKNTEQNCTAVLVASLNIHLKNKKTRLSHVVAFSYSTKLDVCHPYYSRLVRNLFFFSLPALCATLKYCMWTKLVQPNPNTTGKTFAMKINQPCHN